MSGLPAMRCAALGGLALVLAFAGAAAGQPSATRVFRGRCTGGSHVAEGVTAQELKDNRSGFSCRGMTISASADDPNRLTVEFAGSGPKDAPMIGFSGLLGAGDLLTVQSAYLRAGAPPAMTQGACRFSSERNRVRTVTCVASIVQRDSRTVVVVDFEAASPYRPLRP